MRSAAACVVVALCVASAPAVRAADAAHPGVLVVDRAGVVVVAVWTAHGEAPSLVRVRPDGGARVVHRFVPYDTPGSLALIGDRVYGLDGFPESGGAAFEVAGNRFRTVFRVPDDGFGTIAYDPGVPASAGLAFSIDGGRGALCRPRKGQNRCGAIESVGPSGARRVVTFARPGNVFPLAGAGRSAWFAASDSAGPRVLVLRAGRLATLDTGGRFAIAAAPYGAGVLLALQAGKNDDDVVVASAGAAKLVTLARTHIPATMNAGVTLRTRGRAAYALVRWSGYRANESRLYARTPAGGLRLVHAWHGELGDSVQLHYVDGRGDAIVSAEHRTLAPRATTRGTLLRIGPDGRVRPLPLGPLAARAAVDEAIEGPGGAVWSRLSFYGATVAVVRSSATSARAYPLPAGKRAKPT